MAILRAGLYERVSTEEQALHGYSIQTQIDDLTEYCARNGLRVVDHYTDEGISGAKPPTKRPALRRLLDDVEAGRIDIILFTKLDRWFRSVREYYRVQDVLEAHDVAWRTIYEDYDTTTANGRMALNIFLAVAQNERDRTSERIKVVFEGKRRRGEACFGGAVPPFGYKKERDEAGVTRLVKDPETRQACEDFWRILTTYGGINKAIRYMGTQYGIYKDWKSWSRMTQKDFYTGSHDGVPDFCEPYVSPQAYAAYRAQDHVKQAPTGNVYLFRGLMRCPQCGGKLCGETAKRPYASYKQYRCHIRSRGCSNHRIYSEPKIEAQLLERLDDFLQGEIASVELEAAKPKPKPQRTVAQLRERQRRLTVAYMAGNIADDEYLREDAEIKASIATAEREAPPPPRDVAPLRELLKGDFRALYEGLGDEDKQRFWRGLLREIVLDGRTVVGVKFF